MYHYDITAEYGLYDWQAGTLTLFEPPTIPYFAMYSFINKVPSFVLSKDLTDSDWDPLFVIDWNAFLNFPELKALSPGGLFHTHRANNVAAFKRSCFDGPTERIYAKITEAESGEITSFISARVFRSPTGNDDTPTRSPIKLPQIEDAADRAFYEWYWDRTLASIRGCGELHVPHVHIQVLATDPKWEGNGAGSMLMKWILEFTAKEKLGRCALQASPKAVGIGFYEKFGFRVVDKVDFIDEDKFPGRKGTSVVTMVTDL